MRHVVIAPLRRDPYGSDRYVVEVDYRVDLDRPGRVMRFRSWDAAFNCLLLPYYATVRVLWSELPDRLSAVTWCRR